MQDGIIVFWRESQEVIEFDFDNIESIASADTTTQYLNSGEVYQYRVRPQIIETSVKLIKVKIQYDIAINHHIPTDTARWGKAIFIIERDSNSGIVQWIDNDNPNLDTKRYWTHLCSPIRSNSRQRTPPNKLKREQVSFRASLIQQDQQCVITGETLDTVLEAAHILPVAKGGLDIATNGILLRCDLHKLYDNGDFSITPEGLIVASESIRESKYFHLLNGKTISRKTQLRVKNALIEKVSG